MKRGERSGACVRPPRPLTFRAHVSVSCGGPAALRVVPAVAPRFHGSTRRALMLVSVTVCSLIDLIRITEAQPTLKRAFVSTLRATLPDAGPMTRMLRTLGLSTGASVPGAKRNKAALGRATRSESNVVRARDRLVSVHPRHPEVHWLGGGRGLAGSRPGQPFHVRPACVRLAGRSGALGSRATTSTTRVPSGPPP